MSVTPAANRSFLHGNLTSVSRPPDKVVYATLDCLALKRARLPLQLVPVDSNASAKSDKTDSDRRSTNTSRKASSRRPSFKVRSGAGLHWKQRQKVNLMIGKFENTHKEIANRQSSYMKNGTLSTVPYKNVAETVPELLDMLLNAQASLQSPEQNILNKQEKLSSHRKKNKTDVRKQTKESGSTKHEAELNSFRKSRNDDQCGLNVPSEAVINQLDSIFTSNASKELTETGYSTIKLPDSHLSKLSKQSDRGKGFSANSRDVRTASGFVKSDYPKTNLKSSKLKSLSREELRNVKISEPKHFVHIASATNPKLMTDENQSGINASIITHEQKCATMPHFSAEEKTDVESVEKESIRCRNLTNASKGDTKVGNHKYVPMSPVSLKSRTVSNVKSKAEFFNRIKNDVPTRKEPLGRLWTYEKVLNGSDTKSEKVSQLENGQVHNPAVVKTDENEAEEKNYELMADVSPKPKPNSSFLWSTQQMKISKSLANLPNGIKDHRSSAGSNNLSLGEEKNVDFDDDDYEKYEEYDEYDQDDDEYDHVGPARESVEGDDYDDVGPTPMAKVIEEVETDEDVYDDVIPPSYASIGNRSSVCNAAEDDHYLHLPNPTSNYINASKTGESTLDLARKQLVRELEYRNSKLMPENQYLTINNEYSSLEEISGDRDVYDDVGLPSQERVNSLYAGSTSGFNAREESEWEDLDEVPPPPPPLPLPQRNGISSKAGGGGGGEVQLTPSKKKLGLTWSHKVRIQRCKASRENSEPSSNQNTHDHTSVDSGSDNSNYETLYSSQLDDFSSDSETEKGNAAGDGTTSPKKDDIYAEAPSRPTPPPPREASLTQTLGRRMKLLRRTWSLTKGSLGRIRKKSPGDQDSIYAEAIPKDPNTVRSHTSPNIADPKKYFSFKKHFRKSVTGLSTFYLDKNENNFSPVYADDKEKIYSNGNWSSGESRSWRDDDSMRSQNSNADGCSLLAEEPLYQFYAAAAARVAFESDSDGYEEVEDLIPTQAATNLAKPGHRTLWCQTPQVVNNGLHQRLTVEERKLQEAKFEILTSEASYLSSLRVLEEEFVRNLEVSPGMLTASEKEKLFGGVPGIRKASERLLADLENVWTEDPMMHGLPDVLLKHAKRSCSVYVQYCSNQVSIDTTLKELRARKGSKFLEILSRIETHPTCQSLSLHSFLMLPMQRVTRLPLLADAVLTKLSSDHSERLSWESVLSSLSRVVAECNEGARAAGQQVEMEALARKLEYPSKLTPITLRDKYLIRSGPVVQLSPKTDGDYKLTFGRRLNKTPLYLFLLTDYLLVTKPKLSSHDETYAVIDTCKRNLITMESVAEDSPWAGRHAMILTLLENHLGREVEFVLTCDSDTELMRWMDVVSPPKSSLIGETLYESWDCPQVMALYSYAPVQPDELALHPGDVINVLRKMADGWNHGEKLLDGEQGWFPANYTKEVASEHVRARNLKQRHRLLAVTGNLLQKRGKSNNAIY